MHPFLEQIIRGRPNLLGGPGTLGEPEASAPLAGLALIQTVETDDPRLRRFVDQVAERLNSLIRQNVLVKDRLEDSKWSLNIEQTITAADITDLFDAGPYEFFAGPGPSFRTIVDEDLPTVGVASGTYIAHLSIDDWGRVRTYTNVGFSIGSNIALGEDAGNAITSGTANTILGWFAGDVLTTAESNVLVGALAGLRLISGNSNVFIGASAGRLATTALQNVCVGAQAGEDMTSAFENVYVGQQCGQNTTTGAGNVGLGKGAVFTLTEGEYNSCFGHGSGFDITTGDDNVFCGDTAGSGCTTGGFNLAIGKLAGGTETIGNANVSGSYNTFLGTYAGPGNTDQVSGVIAIGAYSHTTAQYQFVAGSVTYPILEVYFGEGVVSDGAPNTRIHGTGATGTNVAGGTLTLCAGQSTGNATPGSVVIEGTVAEASSSTAQTLFTHLTIGDNAVTAAVSIYPRAGTATAGTAPIYLTSGTSLTSAVAGAVEFTTDDLFFTITTSTARKRIVMADAVGGLTSGRLVAATTNGRLIDFSGGTWNGTTLVIGNVNVAAQTVRSGVSGLADAQFVLGQNGTDRWFLRCPSGTADLKLLDASGDTILSVAQEGPLQVRVGTTTSLCTLGGSLSMQTSTAGVGNAADATDDTLFTYTLPANSFTGAGKMVVVWSSIKFGATANNKRAKIFFAGTAIADSAVVTHNNVDGAIMAIVTWIDSTHVSCLGIVYASGTAPVVTVTPNLAVSDLTSNTSIIKTTGASPTSSAANDVVGYMQHVYFGN
jgi:hypothetical protein